MQFNFAGMTGVNCRIKGFDVTGSNIRLQGFEITGVRQNNSLNHESWGVWISGSNNMFEKLNTHNNMGPGPVHRQRQQQPGAELGLARQLRPATAPVGPARTRTASARTSPPATPGNIFRGCRAWWNTDDGFDLINAYSSVTIENSWAWRNGYLPQTTTAAQDGNGFKMGGYGGVYASGGVKHTVRNSVAFLNRSAGFYANHHTVANDYFNNTSFNNASADYNMLGINSSGAAVGLGNLRNNIAYKGTLTANMTGTSASYNSWNLSVTMADSQFQSVSTTGWEVSRQSDGSLPALTALHLASGSTLINKGTNVGLAYNGSAPDLGAFETS